MTEPPIGSHGDHAVDAAPDLWAGVGLDDEDETHRRLALIRSTHVVTAPAVIAIIAVFLRDNLPAVAGVAGCYLVILAATWLVRRKSFGVAALAAIDLVVIAAVAVQGPVMWLAMLVPVVAVVSIGWSVGYRATILLTVLGIGSMAGAGLVSEPPGQWVVLSLLTLCLVGLNRTNLGIYHSERSSTGRVADMVGSLPVIVWEADGHSGELRRAVGRVHELLGHDARHWLGLTPEDRIHPDDIEARNRSLSAALHDSGVAVSEFRMRRADGAYLMVREVVRTVPTDGGTIMRGVIVDVTEERRARELVDRLAGVVDKQREALVVVAAGAPGRPAVVLHGNRAFDDLTDHEADHGADTTLAELAPWLPAAVLADVDSATSGRVSAPRVDVEVSTPVGERVFDIELVPLSDGSVAIQFMDVTDRKIATELIRHQAFHDVLTGLPNRSLLFDRLTQSLAASDRDASTIGLLLLDLDQFKEINDTLGHSYGDDLLRVVGDRLSSLVRRADTVARLGGDEFALLVIDTNEGELADVAARVTAEVKRPIALGGIEVEVGASVGGVIAPHHGSDPHVLLQRADVAMYEAKRSAHGFRLYAADDDRHSVNRLALMGELSGLLMGELDVWYQPMVDLATGRPTGFEALARWNHPRLGLLEPEEFLELCEVSGLIGDLTWRVLDDALRAASEMAGDMAIAVNLPVRNLYDRNLPEGVHAMLRRHGVDPYRLVLEITEREIMDDLSTVSGVLRELHDRGVRLAIDDFGTGFSSLSHLRRLPFQKIKIDRSFVAGMVDNESDFVIARSIIELAHNLGQTVVAEGVEDVRVADLLQLLGCDAGQGFLYARPAPLDDALRWLDDLTSPHPGARSHRRGIGSSIG